MCLSVSSSQCCADVLEPWRDEGDGSWLMFPGGYLSAVWSSVRGQHEHLIATVLLGQRQFLDDEVEPVVVEASEPHLLVWSLLWTARPDARVRFELIAAGAGLRLRWIPLVEEPEPEAPLLGHLRKRLNQLINAKVRHSMGQ